MSKQNTLQDSKVRIQFKLASLWTSFMFLYIYVDYFALYMPDKIDGILKGKIFVFTITPESLLVALVSVSIPALMIFLSTTLPARANRLANLIIATVFIPYSLFNLVGEAWIHMIFGAIAEVVILCLIILEIAVYFAFVYH